MADGKLIAFVGRRGGAAQYSIYDPRYYSAAADGATDDSAKIASAIGAGGLFLDYGITYAYKPSGIASALAAISGIFRIWGGGKLKMLTDTGNPPAFTLTGSASITFESVILDGNSNTGANPVLYLNGASNVDLIRGVILGGGANPAIKMNNATAINLHGIDTTAQATGLLLAGTCTYDARQCRGIADNIGGF